MFFKVKKKHINMVSASIVLYKENKEKIKKTIDSFLNIPLEKELYLIDNSPTNVLESQFKHIDITYIFVGKNIGFGSAHNLILNKISSNFHLILNPDIVFSKDVVLELIEEIKKHPSVSFVTPNVVYPSREKQFVCRKHPTFLDLINRRLKISKSYISKNQYQHKNLEKPFYPDFIHGCFMFFKTKDLKKIKGFDERYFLYMEDADICRKIQYIGKKILYFPEVTITHQYQKGSSKNTKLFFYHLSSAIKYFLKWGF